MSTGRFPRLLNAHLRLAIASLCCASLPLHAEIEEVIVTAQKREQNIQDVGMSVQALSERDFRELGAGDLDRFAAQVPNVQGYSSNNFNQSLHVRGIGLNEFQGQYDSPVGWHVDEVYISKPWMLTREPFDIERIEVLKGPQGTLFGRNTTGGAVNYYTQAPSEEFEGHAMADLDSFSRATVTGAISGPVSGNLLGRLSVYSRTGSGGWQDNAFDNDEAPQPDVQEVRAQLAWRSDVTSVRVMLHAGKNDSDGQAWKSPGIFSLGGAKCPELLSGDVSDHPDACFKYAGAAAASGRPELERELKDLDKVNVDAPTQQQDDFHGGYFRLEHDFGSATLTSLTAYEFYERDVQEDSDASPVAAVNTNYFSEMKQFNQEFRLTGEVNDNWRYLLGVFYEKDELAEIDGSDLSGNPLGIAPPFASYFYADFDIEVESAAVFLNQEFDLSDDVTLTFGLRATRDDTRYDGVTALGLNDRRGKQDRVTPCIITTFAPGTTGIASPACPFLGPQAPDAGYLSGQREDSDTSGRLGLDWRLTDAVMAYVNATTGYRSGGYSSPFGGAVTEFDPEEITALEAGLKSRLFDDTLQLNVALFHNTYDDAQINVDDPISPVVPITRNVGKAVYRGAELDAAFQPDEHWTVRLGVGYMDAEFENSDRVISVYSNNPGGLQIPVEGNRPVNTPEWTLNGLIRYQREAWAGWDLVLMSDARWVDKRYLEVSNQAFDVADSYAVVNLRASLRSQDGAYELAVYGKNVFDEEYLTYMNNIAFFKIDVWNEPASYGVQARYNF